MNIELKILNLSKELNYLQKLHLVDFLESILGKKRPKPTQNLLKFAGSIPKNDLQIMQKSIEDDCNTIDEDEW